MAPVAVIKTVNLNWAIKSDGIEPLVVKSGMTKPCVTRAGRPRRAWLFDKALLNIEGWLNIG
jgi:hypothetical protein